MLVHAYDDTGVLHDSGCGGSFNDGDGGFDVCDDGTDRNGEGSMEDDEDMREGG